MPLSQEDLKELGQGNEKMSLRQPRIPRTDESKKKKQEQVIESKTPKSLVTN